jgi:hypothetical protein
MTVTWTCNRCGESHTGLPDIAFDAPTHWSSLTHVERERSLLETDLCEIHADEGDFYYVRSLLEVPIVDAEPDFAYGVWGSLSRDNFDRFVALYDDPARVDEPAYFSWLSNAVPGFPDTLDLAAELEIRDANLRPFLVLEPTDHPLAIAQREGITLATAFDLVEPHLHC